MSINFEFNAPQFVNTSEDPDADKFFDVAFDNEETEVKKYLPKCERNQNYSAEDQEIENKDPCANINVIASSECENLQIDEKKSPKPEFASKGYEKQLLRGIENLTITSETSQMKKTPSRKAVFEGIELEQQVDKLHKMVTRLDVRMRTPILKLRHRSIVRPAATRNSEGISDSPPLRKTCSTAANLEKPIAVKRKASPLSGQKKFISLAERVHHFHLDTPDRFRSIPKNQHARQNFKPLKQTLPKTPTLLARHRHRPVDFPNKSEREEIELEEMKKHQIKANPLKERILKEPVINLKFPVEKKPSTVPEPFNLTQTKKKDQPRTPVFIFKAQPAPTAILNGPVGIPQKMVPKITVPLTPNIKVPERYKAPNNSLVKTSGPDGGSNFPRTTKVEPFSFDRRIKDMLQKKEENIKKIIEEEKKSFNSFKALPLPNYLARGNLSHNSSLNRSVCRGVTSHLNPKKEQMDGNKNESQSNRYIKSEVSFRAKPATVVHQKPFVPTLRKHECLLPEDIRLNTEKRALERQKFDDRIKKKEEALAEELRKQKEEEERAENVLKLEERKLTEFKAKPVPRYKPFEIVKSDPCNLTSPHSPNFFARKN